MAKATLAGISTLGITFSYGVETVAGTKPDTFTTLDRINSLGGVATNAEAIDASALEDQVTRRVRGRSNPAETFDVVVNWTPETYAQWAAVVQAFNTAQADGKRVWFQTIIPGFEAAEFIVAQPPTTLPIPEKSQNQLLTSTITLVIEEFVGMQTKVAPTAA